ncbi:S8 family serine peptidase [Lacrimispora sp.]|uniref:S8 family serine peptidase n=1 Tax=Lacrimispora sp. TaxID=2719234 RepID=UPI0028AF7F94|nr:S8 family serine peptidase [Lacrimispora sp.]
MELFYWSNEKKVSLKRSDLYRAFKDNSNKESKNKSFTSNLNSNLTDLKNGIILETISENQVNESNSFSSKNQRENDDFMVVETEDKTPMILTNQFIIQFKSDVTAEEINKLNDFNNVKVIENINGGDNTFLVETTEGNAESALKLANTYQKDDKVIYAQPNFVRLIKPMSSSPNDTYVNKQWAINNTGQTGGIVGEDINVLEAWDITKGSKDIIIAIVDEGVDYTHEDLNVGDKLVTGYDACFKRDNPNPETTDAHGTACAGIAAAKSNNNKGIAGVAPDCKIMGIRIAYGVESGGEIVWVTDDAKIADGIVKSVDRGADVLSNSWGGGGDSQTITNAINYAKQKGRNGKGCVVCFAAGNDNGKVSYPGNLDSVITVAACNEYGQRKSKTSKDGEYWWGSNYGPQVDVAAPGVHIYTTDIMNKAGYSTGNYEDGFNGTSAATPHVAGVAALVLSVAPALKASEVEEIIKNTADDITPKGFDNYTGYGRINAFKAVSKALEIVNADK